MVRREHTQRSGRGFTLIEILIVMAIIAVLSAILFPALGTSRERARRSACMTHLRFVGMAIRQYSQDFDETLPLWSVNDSEVSATSPYGWADAVVPYIKNPDQFQCAGERSVRATDTDNNGTLFDDEGSVDFFYNPRLSGQAESALNYFANTIMIGDYTTGDARNVYDGGSGNGPLSAGPSGAANIRHSNGANYAFADGHSKWLKPERTLGGTASPDSSSFTYAIN